MNLTEKEILYQIMITLGEISITLKSMKQQEFEYWETWKRTKLKIEVNK